MAEGVGAWKQMKIDDLMISIAGPEEKGEYPAYYMHLAVNETKEIGQCLKNKQLILITITSSMDNWNRHMSPWPAKAPARRMADFTGEADDYIHKLTDRIIPSIEGALKEKGYLISSRGIAGYSMGGLFALYAMTKTDLFTKAASVSGSLWYEHFIQYMEKQSFREGTAWYLSLGDREAKTKNLVMSQVEKNTLQLTGLLKERKLDVFYEVNQGGHFEEAAMRMAKGIDCLFDFGY